MTTLSRPSISYSRHRHVEPLPDAPSLEAHALCVAYPGETAPALEDISLRVMPGQRIALVGPNGAGKSTLLRAVVGLLPICSGRILVYGHPVAVCRHRVAYLPQRGQIDWRFPIDVCRLVTAGRYVHLGWFGRPGRRDRAIVDAALARLGLTGLAGRQIGELSGGQQQRALLARALAQEADLLLLDEPLNAVDAETRAVVTALLADLRHDGKTVLMATHDLGRLATDFDGALYLSGGREVEPPPGAFVGQPVGQVRRPSVVP